MSMPTILLIVAVVAAVIAVMMYNRLVALHAIRSVRISRRIPLGKSRPEIHRITL